MHERFMREALALAEAALAQGEVPVGAVVVCEGKVIARAHNERETLGDPTAHAEILALRRAAQVLGRRRLTGCILYVTLEPCPMCAGGIIMAEMDAVYYGGRDRRAGCAGSLYALPEDAAFGRKIPCMGGLLETECEAVLSKFFEMRRG